MNSRTSRTIAVSLALCALLARVPHTTAQPKPAEPAPPPPSNTALSHRSVTIKWPPDATPPDLTRVLARLYSTQIAGEVAKQTIGLAPEVGRIYASTADGIALTDRSASFDLRVNLDPNAPGVRLASQEYADALVGRLTSLLEADRREQAERKLQAVRANAEMAQDEFKNLHEQIRRLRAEFRAATGRADVSPQNIEAAVAKLEDERQRLELELAGMEARSEAVQEHIQRATATAEKSADADPVVAELRKAVATREKLFDITRRQFEEGMGGPTDVSQAEVALVEARVQLLDRQGNAASRGGEAAAALNRELQTLTIDIRDREARLQHIKKRLEPLRDSGDQLAQMEMLEAQATAARRAWEDARDTLRQLERRSNDEPVDRVIVLQSSDIPPQP